MKIYLDTSHLQKWQQLKLPSTELLKLNKLRDLDKNQFVLSLSHIIDICKREDEDKIMELAKFLDQLPKIWIPNIDILRYVEIKNAINNFKSHTLNIINPYTNDFIDTLVLMPNSALSISLMRRGSDLAPL